MNWNDVSLENLETLAAALTDYLALRRQQAAQSQVVALEQEQRQVSLELDEARAEMAAQRELSARLMVALRIATDADKPASVAQDKTLAAEPETAPPPEPESLPLPHELSDPGEYRLSAAVPIPGADKPSSVAQEIRPEPMVPALPESLPRPPELPDPGELFTSAEIAALDFPAPDFLPDDDGIFDPVDLGQSAPETPPKSNLNGFNGVLW